MEQNFEKALKALQKLKREDGQYLDEVHLVISLNKLPPKYKLRPLVLKSSLSYSPKTCFVLKDKDTDGSSLIEAAGQSSADIYEITKLKSKFKVFEEKRVFASLYERILVDERIFHLIPSLFGKAVFKKIKAIIPFDIKSIQKGKQSIEELQKCIYVRISSGSCVDVNLGKLSNSTVDMLSIFKEALDVVQNELGNDSVKTVHIKLPNSISLPLSLPSNKH